MVTSPWLLVPGGLVLQAQGWRNTNPPSSDTHRALYPSACCKIPSNIPTIQAVRNRKEIARAAGLATSWFVLQPVLEPVPEITSVLTESKFNAPSRPETELHLLCLEDWAQYSGPGRLCFAERQQGSWDMLQQTWRSFCLKS